MIRQRQVQRLLVGAWRAVIVSLAACTIPCHAESRHLIDVWTPYQGLPQSRVLSIAQTPDGYLWVSTQMGWIARFDGLRFTPFTPETTPALVSPEIPMLATDDQGDLWIADIDGLLIRYRSGVFENLSGPNPGIHKRPIEWLGSHHGEQRFVTTIGNIARVGEKLIYENTNDPGPHLPESIRQFCQDEQGSLWCREIDGTLGRWSKGRSQPLSPEEIPRPAKINHLHRRSKGGIWIANSSGLWKIENGIISQSLPALPPDSTEILQLAESPNGNLWLRTPTSVILTRDDKIIFQLPLAGLPPSSLLRPLKMHADSSGALWIINAGEELRYIDSDGQVSLLSTHNGLPSDQIDAWFEDKEKNVWLGTAAGLVRLRPRWFHVVQTASNSTGGGVQSIAEDAGGNILLGHANGLSRWREGTATPVDLPSFRPSFPLADVTIAPASTSGHFWIGTVQNGTFLVQNGEIHHPFPYEAAGFAIRVIRRDPFGNIWFGSEFGLFRWDGTSLHKFGPKEGLTPGHIHDISFDKNGDAWIGKANDTITVFKSGRFQIVPIPSVIPDMRIHSVLCGADDNVWIGTVGAGLFHLTRGKVFRYTENDGLPGNSVTQLLEDDAGFLWGGTPRGIFRVSITALDMRSKGVTPPSLFRNFSHADGLPSAECSGGFQPASWKAADGNLWFATTKGAISINPEQVRRNLKPPAVNLEEMRINEEILPLHPGSTKPQIGPGRHRIEFTFTGISLSAPEHVSFQWMLEGLDRDWVDGQFQRSVTYTALAPGTYRFSVRARSADGIWSIEPARISFRIEPWFWQRPLVQTLFAAAALALAYAAVVFILRRKHQRELRVLEFERSLEQQRFRHKQAMQAERARIAAELHDDLGASLTQIQWLGDAANRAAPLDSPQNQLISRISNKSRDMVRLIDEIVWAMNPKNDTLENLVTYLCSFAEQYFRDSHTRCRIDVSDSIPAHSLQSDCRHHIFLTIKEALHNVAKHAATDRVWIRVRCNEERFHILIEDKGKGFDPASFEAGDGLASMHNRAKLAGATLLIDSCPGQGCRIELSLNLKTLTV